MSLIRPEVTSLMRRWVDPAAGLATVAVGVWTIAKGGWLPLFAGLAFVALGAGWAILGLRRARFDIDPGAPGLVEVTEARVRYLHPKLGGEISLDDLAELRLTKFRGRQMWRLNETNGRALLIPLDAAGAPALFDTFSALPGLSSAALVAALQGKSPEPEEDLSRLPTLALDETRVWRRPVSNVISFRDAGAGRA
ncbi:hypothetical protein [Fuscovulum blasticum]|uniref:hypothetical protein n=1 Tax=Fuscovulum blasticum TaxID=1075 RepID=UPI000D3EBD3F|nr:hypothetical protein [Fuscovulum blasticum]AWD22655.1 hypothetical protein B6K69_14060 [Fuscovulum blasticum]